MPLTSKQKVEANSPLLGRKLIEDIIATPLINQQEAEANSTDDKDSQCIPEVDNDPRKLRETAEDLDPDPGGEVAQRVTSGCSKRYFRMALKETLPSKRPAVVELLGSRESLNPADKKIIMDNCLYTMAKLMMNVYFNYLLIFPSHRIIIGKLKEIDQSWARDNFLALRQRHRASGTRKNSKI